MEASTATLPSQQQALMHDSVDDKAAPGVVYQIVLLLPSNSIGLVIGKSGMFFKEVLRETGVRFNIQYFGDIPHGSAQRSIIISGSKQAVLQAAVKVVLKMQAYKPYESSVDINLGIDKTPKTENSDEKDADTADESGNSEPITQIKWAIPQAVCGILIGKNGSRIKAINEQSGAWVKVAHLEESSFTSVERFVYIRGTESAVQNALKMVKTLVGGHTPVGAAIQDASTVAPNKAGTNSKEGSSDGDMIASRLSECVISLDSTTTGEAAPSSSSTSSSATTPSTNSQTSSAFGSNLKTCTISFPARSLASILFDNDLMPSDKNFTSPDLLSKVYAIEGANMKIKADMEMGMTTLVATVSGPTECVDAAIKKIFQRVDGWMKKEETKGTFEQMNFDVLFQKAMRNSNNKNAITSVSGTASMTSSDTMEPPSNTVTVTSTVDASSVDSSRATSPKPPALSINLSSLKGSQDTQEKDPAQATESSFVLPPDVDLSVEYSFKILLQQSFVPLLLASLPSSVPSTPREMSTPRLSESSASATTGRVDTTASSIPPTMSSSVGGGGKLLFSENHSSGSCCRCSTGGGRQYYIVS